MVLITGEQPASERFELSGISPQAGKYTLYGAALLQVDKCNLASQTLQDNGGRTLVGDIGVPSVQVCIHQAIQSFQHMQGSVTVAASISDTAPRGDLLRHVFRIGWRLCAACIILECNTDIAHQGHLLAALHAFAPHAAFRVAIIELDLGSVWVSSRPRWWCCITPAGMRVLALRPFPSALHQGRNV